MRLLSGLFTFIHIVGYVGLGLLALYVEWLFLRSNFFQIFNPFLHFQVLFYMIKLPITWILLACSIIGFFSSLGVEKLKEEM